MGERIRTWRVNDKNSNGWLGDFHIGRLKVGWRLWQHHYGGDHVSDRWVFQPMFTFDRKPVDSGSRNRGFLSVDTQGTGSYPVGDDG